MSALVILNIKNVVEDAAPLALDSLVDIVFFKLILTLARGLMIEAAERVVAHLDRSEPLVGLRVVAANDVDVLVVDVDRGVAETTHVHGGVLLERVHAHVHLVHLVARVVHVIAARDQQSPVLLGVHQSRVLSQLGALNGHSTDCLLKGLVEIHCLVLHLD